MVLRRPPSSMPPPRGGDRAPTNIAEGLTMLADLVGQALEQGTSELSRAVQMPLSRVMPGLSEDRGMIDASLRVRTVEAASTTTSTAASPSGRDEGRAAASRAREPLVDVFDEGTEVVIAAEVPGCGIDDVDIAIDDDGAGLTLTANGPRGYRRHLPLPEVVDPDPIEKSCKNGVLNLRLVKHPLEAEPGA